ncbi:hypothetical protein WJX74_000882 [Apatococcus lobatus]|uniref:Calcineurin-like phosphoesterase domain-containing protein n=1 Tax=Apatococcus lobatus TaxID=904363 RepID=A0AAW1Q502_9CHLO
MVVIGTRSLVILRAARPSPFRQRTLIHSSAAACSCLNTCAISEQGPRRVLAVSDLHVDHPENFKWTNKLAATDHRHDVLIVAGDISHNQEKLSQTLQGLTKAFWKVFFVVGNHELWTRAKDDSMVGAEHSPQKMQLIHSLCADLGVLTKPTRLGPVLICPLISWHHQSFDREPDIPGVPRPSPLFVSDYRACTWPEGFPGIGTEELAQWFDAQNEPAEQILDMSHDADVISFSHFLPLQALLPEKRNLFYSGLAKAVGSDFLARRIAELQPSIHLFGHTHFGWDATLDGIRYIQAPLCTPRERLGRLGSIILHHADIPPSRMTRTDGAGHAIPDTDPLAADWLPVTIWRSKQDMSSYPPGGDWQALKHGCMCPPLHARWSDYFQTEPRRPDDLTLAPWVKGVRRQPPAT